MESTGTHYLHPLTLECKLFLRTLEACGNQNNQIDPTLCEMLNSVVLGIQNFLDRRPALITSTEKTKVLQITDLSTIENIYHCTFCNKNVAKSAYKAALHLVDRHRVISVSQKEGNQKTQAVRNKAIKLPKKAKALVMTDLSKFFEDHLKVAEKVKQIPEYAVIEDALLTALKKALPDKSPKLYKFGSRISGIGTRCSDLDIYVDVGGQFNVFEQSVSEETLSIFDRVLEVIRNSAMDWHQVRPVRGAKVPIIRMTNIKTNIECDIGFSNSLSYSNTQLVEYIYKQQPLVRRLCIFMKKWLERTRMKERITTYCMTLMVIYYLQTKNCLPSIETLQKKLLANVFVGPWICNFSIVSFSDFNIEQLSVNTPNVKKHIIEFCKFYSNFHYGLYVVCPYLGRADIEKKNFESLMPQRYINFVRNENPDREFGLHLNCPIVVQDPFEMNHNVAKRASIADLKDWKEYLKQTVELMSDSK